MRLLFIDNDRTAGMQTCQRLEEAQYTVDWVKSGEEGFRRAIEGNYNLILLEVDLPQRGGLDICYQLRSRRDTTPVLLLSRCGTIEDRVRGLEAGADDYLVKPFAFPELRARLLALLRRESLNRTHQLQIGDLIIDTGQKRVEWANRELNLTPREFSLLELLAQQEGQAVSRERIQLQAWKSSDNNSNAIDVCILSLRRKFKALVKENIIQTVYGKGYRLSVQEKSNATISPTIVA